MITFPTKTVFEEIAQKIGIRHPSLVEKDFFTVKALSICATVKSELFLLVFAGGTCLSKTYKAVERMSEDVDIKIIQTDAGNRLSRTALKKSLKSIRNEILNALKSEGLFVPSENVKSRNEYHYTELKIPYPQQFVSSVALRPEIKLDLTLSTFLSSPIIKPVGFFFCG
jgi:predicted nucleotidyltransferase component of viral defense system